ncbi:MAG TPA: EamA family transporter [Gemmatimonadaceae bacterium]|jgi:drug/metabolite transporter (DMT)-like permease|nr:EamA family transporter [Gemmatimonadaceae bacterium]
MSDSELAMPGAGTARAGSAGLTDGLLVLMAVIWAVNYTVAKFGTNSVPPLAYNAVRIAMAVVALLAIRWIRAHERLTRHDLVALVGIGVLGNGLYQLCFIEGLARSRAGTVALMLAASPAFVAIAGRIFRVEHVGARGWSGIALQLAGIACVVFGSVTQPAGDDTVLGSALIVAGSVFWALFAILIKPYTERLSGIDVGAYSLAGGAVFVTLIGIPSLLATDWRAVTVPVWGAIVYSGLGALVVGNLIWYYGVSRIGPTRVSMYSNLQPLVALAVAWMVLGEVPTVWQGLGAGSIMTGLIITRT